MKEKLENFEDIADLFSKTFNAGSGKMSTVSRCDRVVIRGSEVLFIEETNLNTKDLIDPNTYAKEILENVKKMWGSLSVFVWYVSEKDIISNVKGKDRIYILSFEHMDGRTARFVSNMIKTLRRYRNGGFADVKFETTSSTFSPNPGKRS